MAMGEKQRGQQEMWVATHDLPKSPVHPFYQKLNRVLAEAGFDRKVQNLCEPYDAKAGRPSIPPGVYFRMLLIGYFDGIDSQRGTAWRCRDSLSLKEFLRFAVTDSTLDHSSLTYIRKGLPLEVHHQIFLLVLEIALAKKLLWGKSVAVGSTTLEANAALKSIVRKDTGEDWEEYLTRLVKEDGIEDPIDDDLHRFDRKRKDKRVSNKDSRITKMKDGRTHLAYKAEHTVDLESDLVLEAQVQRANREDVDTLVGAIVGAQLNLMCSGSEAVFRDATADKTYHSAENLALLDRVSVRTYIPDRKLRGPRKWKANPVEQNQVFCTNRRRMKGKRGRMLQRKRSELTERSFAHDRETGGARRTRLRGLENINERYPIQVAARNLGVELRRSCGVGTPWSLQTAGISLFDTIPALRVVIGSLRRRGKARLPLAIRFGGFVMGRTQFQFSVLAR